MTRFVDITCILDSKQWTLNDISIEANAKVMKMARKCGVKNGVIFIYRKVNGRWENQTKDELVVDGGEHDISFVRNVVLHEDEKERIVFVERQRYEMRQLQLQKKRDDKAILPERRF